MRWFHLSRWENYCLLAFASVALMVFVAMRTENVRRHQAMASRELVARARSREPTWRERHAAILAAAREGPYDVMLLGDSLSQGWELNRQTWSSAFPDVRALNAGIISDRVEHILWRVENGLFAKARPKVVVLLAGINNVQDDQPRIIADGIGQVIRAIRARAPGTKILVLGLLPSGAGADNPRRARIARVNEWIEARTRIDHAEYLDIGAHLLDARGNLAKAVAFDGLHLTHKGYRLWADAMAPKLNGMLDAGK